LLQVACEHGLMQRVSTWSEWLVACTYDMDGKFLEKVVLNFGKRLWGSHLLPAWSHSWRTRKISGWQHNCVQLTLWMGRKLGTAPVLVKKLSLSEAIYMSPQ